MLATEAEWSRVVNFDDYSTLLELARNSLIAGVAVALVAGLLSPIGMDVVLGSIGGSLIAAFLLGAMGTRARDRNSIVGVLMPFGSGSGCFSSPSTRAARPTSSAC